MTHPDPLLSSLVWLSAHHGHARSAESIISGLDYTEKGMDVDLFLTAARRLGFKGKVQKFAKLSKINTAVLPCVLVLQDQTACILISQQGEGATILDPRTGKEQVIDLAKLRSLWSGYVIYVHPAQASEKLHGGHWLWQVIWDSKA